MQKPDPEVLAAWTALLMAHRSLTSALDTELRDGADMSLDEYDVLFQLTIADRALSMSELADSVLITRPTATRIVDRLVGRGWIDRRDDELDRRIIRLQLTASGRAAQRRAGALHLDGIARLVGAPLGQHDAAAVAAALEALVARED